MINIMSVRAPDNLQALLKRQAQEQGLTRNALILQILWEWVNRYDLKEKEEIYD